MGSQAPVEPDEKQVNDATAFWTDFNKSMFYGIYGVIAVLILMALMFVNWG